MDRTGCWALVEVLACMKASSSSPVWLASAILAWIGLAGGLHGQWLTQSMELRPGWNAVQLHVDSSHGTLEELIEGEVANPIEEVWLWTPAVGTAQFVQSPQVPTASVPQWTSWKRSLGAGSELRRLPGNAAALVRVGPVGTNYVWRVKGRPVAPRNAWTATGLNFLGMPVPEGAGVTVEAFVGPAARLRQDLDLFRYNGGELDAGNPARIFGFRSNLLRRGEAFWMRSGGAYNRYFGPVEVRLQTSSGVDFGRRAGEQRIRVRNVADRPVVVRMALMESEAAPTGQRVVAGLPPLLLRGALNTTNLTFGHSLMTTATEATWSLAASGEPGADVEVVLGLDRYAMGGADGEWRAGVLRFTDSLGLSQVDVPVTAESGSWSGLWMGDAMVGGVRHALGRYARGADGATMRGADGKPMRLGTMDGMGGVGREFAVRLLVHVEGTHACLVQRVYVGLDRATNRAVALREELLGPGALAGAKRLSSVHFPWTEANRPWAFAGSFERDGAVEARVVMAYDDARSNPFVHGYHPDHDNLDASFTAGLPRGRESWDVERRVRLRIRAPGTDFQSLSGTSDRIDAWYDETMTFSGTGSEQRTHEVTGAVRLRRVSDVPVLTRE